jgi:hypothetical protein
LEEEVEPVFFGSLGGFEGFGGWGSREKALAELELLGKLETLS